MITPARIAALRELLTKAALPETVEAIPDMFNGKEELWGRFHSIKGFDDIYFDGDMVGDNAALIVAAINALPAMLDALEVALSGNNIPGFIRAQESADACFKAERLAMNMERDIADLKAQLAESKAKEATEVIYDLDDCRKELKEQCDRKMAYQARAHKAEDELAKVTAERDAAITKANNRELQRQELVHLRAIALANCQRMREALEHEQEGCARIMTGSFGATDEWMRHFARMHARIQLALAQPDKADDAIPVLGLWDGYQCRCCECQQLFRSKDKRSIVCGLCIDQKQRAIPKPDKADGREET